MSIFVLFSLIFLPSLPHQARDQLHSHPWHTYSHSQSGHTHIFKKFFWGWYIWVCHNLYILNTRWYPFIQFQWTKFMYLSIALVRAILSLCTYDLIWPCLHLMLANQWNIRIPFHTYWNWMDQTGDIGKLIQYTFSALQHLKLQEILWMLAMMRRCGGTWIWRFVEFRDSKFLWMEQWWWDLEMCGSKGDFCLASGWGAKSSSNSQTFALEQILLGRGSTQQVILDPRRKHNCKFCEQNSNSIFTFPSPRCPQAWHPTFSPIYHPYKQNIFWKLLTLLIYWPLTHHPS